MRVLKDWILTPQRVALHEPSRTCVVADLHLGYSRRRCQAGEAVPTPSLREELSPLSDLLHRQNYSRLLIAGDLFEDASFQREPLIEELTDWLVQANLDWVGIIPGNHDRGLSSTHLPLYADGIDLGEWRIVHGDGLLPQQPCVQGHEHPYLRIRPGVEGPCFLVRPWHLVLPAWSPDASGVNVLTNPRWQTYCCYVLAGDQILDFGELGDLKKRLTHHR